MILNINFDKKLEPLIRSSAELSNWFEKNQETMAYFELTHPGCLHFEGSSMANYDIVVLGRMADGCLKCLQSGKKFTAEEKVDCAVAVIDRIYQAEKDKLSDNAKELYNIRPEENELESKSITEDQTNTISM